MNRPDSEFLIVGGGIAGLLLAWKLRHSDVRILRGTFPPASRVAAGVLNPVTGRRLARVPDFEEFLKEATATYTRIPDAENSFRQTAIRRFFLSPAESGRFAERSTEPEFDSYLSVRCPAGESGLPVADSMGSFRIEGAAVVDLQPVFRSVESLLGERILNEDADWNSLTTENGLCQLNGIRARTLVCGDGAGVVGNPLFRWLPFRPVGGETLTVRMRGVPDFSEVIQHGKWVLSLGNGCFRIGSTYEKIDLGGEGLGARTTLAPPRNTRNARTELLEAIHRIFPSAGSVEVLDQRSGIRPASRDRVPYLGPHPEIPNVFICNGLGSKGTLYAPLLCETLAKHLLSGTNLPEKWLPARMLRRGFTPPEQP